MSHIHEKIDFTVSAFIVFNNKVLLRKHPLLKIWLGVGGHIELDEDPNEAVLREAKEEVGLDIKLLSSKKIPEYYVLPGYKELVPPEYMNIHNFNEAHRHCDLAFFAVSDTDVVIPENPGEECKWFTKEELEEKEYDLLADIVLYSQEALKLASGKK